MVFLKSAAGRLCATLLTTLSCAALLSGCARPRQTPPPVDPSKLSDDGFLHYLGEVPVVTVDEGFRAMLILADGEDTSKDFNDRYSKLVNRGIARREWELKAENVIDRGSVAAMVCRICRIGGGVNQRVFGSIGLADRRYAVRDLVYERIMADGPDYAGVKGGELIALLTKADGYMDEQGIYSSQKIELGSEQDALKAAETPSQP